MLDDILYNSNDIYSIQHKTWYQAYIGPGECLFVYKVGDSVYYLPNYNNNFDGSAKHLYHFVSITNVYVDRWKSIKCYYPVYSKHEHLIDVPR